MAKRKLTKQTKSKQHTKAQAKVQEKFEGVHKEEKKRKYREAGKDAANREKKAARVH